VFSRRSHTLQVNLFILLAVVLSASLTPATGQKKSQEKIFGSSLKRLKWDSEKKTVTLIRPEKKETKASDDEDVLKIEANLVACDVIVRDDKAHVVQGLTRNDFLVSEEGKPEEISTFANGDDTAIGKSIILVIDYSGSQLPYINNSIAAAKVLVDKLGPNDRMAIVTDDVELLRNFTRDHEELKKSLDSLREQATGPLGRRKLGRSWQFSALFATLNEMFDKKELRPIIIFQTDGDELGFLRGQSDFPQVPTGLPGNLQKRIEKNIQAEKKYLQQNVREFGLPDLYTAAEKSGATIYTVIPGFRLLDLSSRELLAQYRRAKEAEISTIINPKLAESLRSHLADIPPELLMFQASQIMQMQQAVAGTAIVTGGGYEFLEDATQAEEIYTRIFSDINQRYVIGYQPSNLERDGKRRSVRIEVRDHPEYKIRGRDYYYAPMDSN